MVDQPHDGVPAVLQVVALVGAGGEFGGPVSVAEAQARELSRRGHPVVVAALQRGTSRVPPGLAAPQWRTFPAHRVVPRTGMLGLLSVGFVRYLWSAVRAADVIHIHAGRDLVSLSALLIARVRSVPVVAQTHGMVLPRRHLKARLFDPLFLAMLRRAGVVLYLTEDERRDLREQLGPGARLAFLGNGLELPPPRLSAEPETTPQVLFLARLHPVKGVTAFAEMAVLLRARGVRARYLVHGPDQGDLDNLLHLIDRHGLADVLTYGGPLDHEDAVAALSASAVYVLPSTADWMPMALIEALAAGVPSVCTTSCGLADVLQEAGAAIVTDGSPRSLADAVERIVEDPTESTRLAEAGRSVASERYSIQAVIDELEQIYDEFRIPASTNPTNRSKPTSADRFSLE